MKSIILLVEDDVALGQTLKDFFIYNGFPVLWAQDGNRAIEMFEETPPAIILLDVMVPKKNGIEIATEIRKSNRIVPIIFMTGTALSEKEHIDGYNLHAVNYLEKPVVPQIILAQIKSLLEPIDVRSYNINNFTIKVDNQLLTINNKELNLRIKEIDVLILLLDNVNSVVTREEIASAVWKENLLQVSSLLDSVISNIRKVLKYFPNMKIRTTYAIGYRLEIKELR